MANIIKIDNAVLKRTARVEKKRKERTKEVRVYFLIVCEGEQTEPNYFKSFKTNVKSFVYTIDKYTPKEMSCILRKMITDLGNDWSIEVEQNILDNFLYRL